MSEVLGYQQLCKKMYARLGVASLKNALKQDMIDVILGNLHLSSSDLSDNGVFFH